MSARSAAKGHLLTWGALMLLTTSTLLVSFVMRGQWDIVVALLFATAKSGLVAWIFMHLSEEPPASRLAFAAGVFFVVLLISLVVGDVALRVPLSVKVPPSW